MKKACVYRIALCVFTIGAETCSCCKKQRERHYSPGAPRARVSPFCNCKRVRLSPNPPIYGCRINLASTHSLVNLGLVLQGGVRGHKQTTVKVHAPTLTPPRCSACEFRLLPFPPTALFKARFRRCRAHTYVNITTFTFFIILESRQVVRLFFYSLPPPHSPVEKDLIIRGVSPPNYIDRHIIFDFNGWKGNRVRRFSPNSRSRARSVPWLSFLRAPRRPNSNDGEFLVAERGADGPPYYLGPT